MPLADKIRPQCLDDIVGQSHLLKKNAPLRNMIESGQIPNLIFYGPSGTGKTTVANIIAKSTNKKLCRLNGTNASTADIHDVVKTVGTVGATNGILLYLDEIQYFNKKQQQSLLQYIENGDITLIASTTENPFFYVYSAVLSRCTCFEFKSVTADEIEPAVERAFREMEKELSCEFEIEDGVVGHIAFSCGGDVRKSINAVEALCLSSDIPQSDEKRRITMENAKVITGNSALRYDKNGDEHYDLLSAYQKSMRGSDPDAAIHYLARILDSGDLPSACRRLMVCACEDVGLAYPNIIPIVKAAVDAAMMVGLPEARIPLADAVILVCNSPKSNSAYNAINKASSDLKKGKYGPIPRTLQNKHLDSFEVENKGQFYEYPHSYPDHWLDQQYLPDEIKNVKYYEFGDNKNEQAAKNYWDNIKKKGRR